MNEHRTEAFHAPNLEALRSYLAPASLAATLIQAVEGASTERDATERLAAVVDERLKSARTELDA